MEKYVVKIINTETHIKSEISVFADEAEQQTISLLN